MTVTDIDAIEARANAAMLSPTGQQYDAGVVLSTDVPALVAEVRSLRTMRDAAWQHYDEQVAAKERAALEERDEALRHLTHAAAVEAALTSDLLAAHVEVEQLRVTRATDRNRLRHTRKALAKTRLLLEIRAEQTERLLTDIARVRALHSADAEYEEPTCHHCRCKTCGARHIPHPCATLRALDGDA